MKTWKVVIKAHSPADDGTDDPEALVSEFVARLRALGHVVTHLNFSAQAEDDPVEPE